MAIILVIFFKKSYITTIGGILLKIIVDILGYIIIGYW